VAAPNAAMADASMRAAFGAATVKLCQFVKLPSFCASRAQSSSVVPALPAVNVALAIWEGATPMMWPLVWGVPLMTNAAPGAPSSQSWSWL